jgi:hypothetical protein
MQKSETIDSECVDYEDEANKVETIDSECVDYEDVANNGMGGL